jgi:hypothetical protein
MTSLVSFVEVARNKSKELVLDIESGRTPPQPSDAGPSRPPPRSMVCSVLPAGACSKAEPQGFMADAHCTHGGFGCSAKTHQL